MWGLPARLASWHARMLERSLFGSVPRILASILVVVLAGCLLTGMGWVSMNLFARFIPGPADGRADLLLEVMELALLGLALGLMLAVAAVHAVSTYSRIAFSADNALLLSLPVPGRDLILLRMVQALATSGVLGFMLLAPLLIGFGTATNGPPLFYVLVAPTAAILVAAGVSLGHLVVRALVRLPVRPWLARVRPLLVNTGAFLLHVAWGLFLLRLIRVSALAVPTPEGVGLVDGLHLWWAQPAVSVARTWVHAALGTGLLPTWHLGLVGLATLAVLLVTIRIFPGNATVICYEPIPTAVYRPRVPHEAQAALTRRRAGTKWCLAAKDLRVLVRDVAEWSSYLLPIGLFALSNYLSRGSWGELQSVRLQEWNAQAWGRTAGPLLPVVLATLLASVSTSKEGGTLEVLRALPATAQDVITAKCLVVLAVITPWVLLIWHWMGVLARPLTLAWAVPALIAMPFPMASIDYLFPSLKARSPSERLRTAFYWSAPFSLLCTGTFVACEWWVQSHSWHELASPVLSVLVGAAWIAAGLLLPRIWPGRPEVMV